ncbi:unnamed protein product, partial [Scytosiphon promiscuus]
PSQQVSQPPRTRSHPHTPNISASHANLFSSCGRAVVPSFESDLHRSENGAGVRHRLLRIGAPRADRFSAGHRHGHGAFRRKILHCRNLLPEGQRRRRPDGGRPAARGALRSPRGLQPPQLAGPA